MADLFSYEVETSANANHFRQSTVKLLNHFYFIIGLLMNVCQNILSYSIHLHLASYEHEQTFPRRYVYCITYKLSML